jgi:hypothetical protein
VVVVCNLAAENEAMSAALRPRLLEDLPLLVALCVADASRWLGWWLIKVLVLWGSVLCGLSASADCTVDLPRPHALRHDIALRREVERGLEQLDAYLSTTGLDEDVTRPTDKKSQRTRRAGSDG